MADDSRTGEKTEEATPRKLREARERGDISKSQDVTATVGFAFVLALIWFGMDWGIGEASSLVIDSMAVDQLPFDKALAINGQRAIELFVLLSGMVLLAAAVVGMFIEFLQAGPVFALEKLKPDLSHLDPVAGVQKQFGADNLVELIKSVSKTVILFVVLWFVVRGVMDQLVWLPSGHIGNLIDATVFTLMQLVGSTLAIFLVVAAVDAVWQRNSFAKKQRMSLHDVKQEHKDTEGDPVVKNQRKQLHREWSQESASGAARDATVVVVNPTHVAIAIRYDAESTPIPVVTAKGEEDTAVVIRSAAEEANVPVLRNEAVAWQLLRDVDEGDVIPRSLFDVIAEIVLWAQAVTASMEPALEDAGETEVQTPPGEDLTRYPASLSNPPLHLT